MSKGLQKLPNSESIGEQDAEVINKILAGETLDVRSYEALPDEERNKMYKAFSVGANKLGFDDRDNFLEKIDPILTDDTKRSLWGMNHSKIMIAINKLTSDYNRFPSRVEISQFTGISRQTINKHLKAYFGSEQYHEKQEEFEVMREKLLSKVYLLAIDGDIRAAKLFIETTKDLKPATTIKNQQNNFIQINGTTITEEQLKQLPADKQTQLQEILFAINKPIKTV